MVAKLEPRNTILVVKHDGKEVGRVPALAPNAQAYVAQLASHLGSIQVEYVEDEDASLLVEAQTFITES